jgi:predicted nucleic acid-binding protein
VSEVVFLDTSGWLAAVNPRDTHHRAAAETYDGYTASRTTFVTSNLVIAEMHALIVRERGPKAGCDLMDAVYADPLYCVISVDRDLESRAVENWLRRFTEVRFSLTDAVSFQIMKNERISDVFALDHHFEIAGFRMTPSLRLPKKANQKRNR